VLADAAGEGALEVLCLGDLVGYGADPVACVETVGERASAMVAGNHEHGALGADTAAGYAARERADFAGILRERLDGMLARENRTELAQACFDFLPTRARLDLGGWEAEDIFAHS